jgi:hypothetical protein
MTKVVWILVLDALCVAALVVALSGCVSPIDTHGMNPQIAGRCKLMAHQEDRGSISFGLIPMAIAASNANARRQDIYDSCVAAGGSRESPPTITP